MFGALYAIIVMFASLYLWGVILFKWPLKIWAKWVKRTSGSQTQTGKQTFDKICAVCLHSCAEMERFKDENEVYFHKACLSKAYTYGSKPKRLTVKDLGDCPYSFEVQRNIARINFQNFFRDYIANLNIKDFEYGNFQFRGTEAEERARSSRKLADFQLKLYKGCYEKANLVPFPMLDEVIEDFFSDESQSITEFLPKGSGLRRSHFELSREESLFMKLGPVIHFFLWLGMSVATFFFVVIHSKGLF